MQKKNILFLLFVLMLLVVAGCSKTQIIEEKKSNDVGVQEELEIESNESPEQVQNDLEDAGLDELDDIDLSDW